MAAAIEAIQTAVRNSDALLSWLRNTVNPDGDKRGLILLTHHGCHSAFSDWYQIPAQQLSGVIHRPVIWFWGHEHKLAIYDRYRVAGGIDTHGRCIGHGGMPVERGKLPDLDCPWLAWDNRRYENGEKIDVGFNGHVNLSLDGPRLHAEYVDLNCAPLFTEDWRVDLASGELQGPNLRRVEQDPAVHFRGEQNGIRGGACGRLTIKRIKIAAGLAVVAWMCVSLVSLHASTLSARLNAALDGWKQKNAPGMAVALIRDGRIEYRRSFGFADLDTHVPITSNTQFLLASLTKQFTAMAILILMERHKLGLDDPLAKFCPEFPAYARTITIRHLLNHTAGLTQYQELLVGKIDEEHYFRSSKSPPAAHEFTAAEALQALSRQQELRFPPGEKFEYSDSAYVVLGQIIERISGERYAEFLKETIFDPLGMNDTLVVDERKQKAPRMALSYAMRGGKWQDITYSPENSIYGEDGIYSTINDLYKWDQALYTERLVSRATLEMAFTPGIGNDGKEITTDLLTRPSSYGFGWFISSLHGEKDVEHPGGWAGYDTYILRVPSRRVTAIVLTNSSNDDVDEIAQEMAEVAMK